jgi:hypothetical protein
MLLYKTVWLEFILVAFSYSDNKPQGATELSRSYLIQSHGKASELYIERHPHVGNIMSEYWRGPDSLVLPLVSIAQMRCGLSWLSYDGIQEGKNGVSCHMGKL